MAQSLPEQLRKFIDLVEGQLYEAGTPWGVSRSSLFDASLTDHLRIFPDLREKLQKFIEAKIDNPLTNRYGKHDRPMTGPLVGFWHAHLRDDAIVIYNLINHCINLVMIVSHAEIEGKRTKQMVKRLQPFLG